MSSYFNTSISPSDVVWSYSGVRPLYDDRSNRAQEATRDFTIKVDGKGDDPKLINIFGVKITTYRQLPIEVLDMLNRVFQIQKAPRTNRQPLPSGGFVVQDFDHELAELKHAYEFLDVSTAYRLLRCYGTKAYQILEGAQRKRNLGTDFGAGYRKRKVEYLKQVGWAATTEDIFWRRSKLGLRLSAEETGKLDNFLRSHSTPAPVSAE